MQNKNFIKYLQPQVAAKLGNYKLIAKAIVEGFMIGLHKSPLHGFNAEFSEYRQYFKGDDLRLLDWKIMGKTEKLFIKQFKEETNLTANLILDISNSMSYSSHNTSKINYAKYIISALCYLLFKQHDNFSLSVFNDELKISTPARHSLNHLYHIFSILENCKCENKTSLLTSFQSIAEKIQKRGMVIIVSDFLFTQNKDIKEGLLKFKNIKNEVIVFHIADPNELTFNVKGETIFEDIETGEKIKTQAQLIKNEVQQQIDNYYSEIKKFCLNHKIEYQLINTEETFIKALTTFLTKRKNII